MEQVSTPAAPAQPDAPQTISATQDAANKGDYAAFDDAALASRRGTPLAKVPAPPETPAVDPPPAAPDTPERQVSKRQQETNDRIRAAVDAATADLRAEVARLRQPAAPRSEPTREAVAPAPTDLEPDPDDAATYPEGQFDRKYIKDQARWEARQLLTAELASRDRVTATQHAETQIAQQVHERLTAAHAKGVDVTALLSAPLPIDPSMPGFGSMSGVLVRSDLQVELMQHFVANPNDAIRIAQMPPGAAFREICVLEGRLHARMDASPPTPATPAPSSTITTAPPPLPTLDRPGNATDPTATAIARGDWEAFNQQELTARAAKRARA